jgi:hypothetical protein
VTASNDDDSGDVNEGSSEEDEDDDCVGRRTLYFPRESVEESDDDSSCMDAETMLFAIVLSKLSRRSDVGISQTSNRASNLVGILLASP